MDTRKECWFYGNTTIVKFNFENSIDDLYKHDCFICTVNLIFTDGNNFNYDEGYTFSYFNDNVDNLPPNIKIIRFGHYFNQSVNNLPHMLIRLTFGSNFSKSVDNLPSTLIQLTFGCYFNQPVDNLPSTMTHLTFGEYFNQPVNNLPYLLTHLTFGENFNQSLNYLPINLTHLLLSNKRHTYLLTPIFNHDLNFLPETIEYIRLPIYYALTIDKFPSNLKTIECSKYRYKKQLKNILKDKCKIIYY
jgi:hypothetical protein